MIGTDTVDPNELDIIAEALVISSSGAKPPSSMSNVGGFIAIMPTDAIVIIKRIANGTIGLLAMISPAFSMNFMIRDLFLLAFEALMMLET